MGKISKTDKILIGILSVLFIFVIGYKIYTKTEDEKQFKKRQAQQTSELSKDTQITLSGDGLHDAPGSQKVYIKVNNNSDKDIEYMKIVLYEISKEGKTIQSDWTNTSNILSGASQSVETYFDFNQGDSTMKFEIEDLSFK